MRIDAYNQVSMVYAAAGKTQAKKTAKTSGAEDKLEISQLGRDYQVAKAAVAQADDVREDRVAEVKPEDMMYLRISWQPSLWRGITRLRFRRGDRISGQSDRYTDRHFGKRE